MSNKILKNTLLALFSFAILSFFPSCEKNKETIGVIIVKDADANPLAGATVVLHLDSLSVNPQGNLYNSEELKKTNITDANGRAEFSYDLEAVFQIYARKVVGNDLLTGNNIIRLLREKEVVQEVIIN